MLSILFFSFHLADDIVLRFEKGGVYNLTVIPIYVVWLYGALVLAQRRSGYILMLLGGLFALVVPIAHMRGAAISVRVIQSDRAFFFVWTLLAIGVTGLFSVILAARLLWTLRRASPDSRSA